jgi:gamma-glutamyltranspeptidase / glutathione hydrolase
VHRIIFVFLLFTLFISCDPARRNAVVSHPVNPYKYNSQKKVVADNGVVVSAHPLASKVGIGILKKGGNAIDAAIATQLTLAVVYPQAGNLGGGGFTVARLADGKLLAIDYREKAPGAAHRDMYLDQDGTPRTDKSQQGHLASGVPGSVAGIFAALPYAKLSFDQLIDPAIELAEKGYAITLREANGLNDLQDELKAFNTMPTALMKERGWKEGDTLVQKDLAATLRRLKISGHAGFYEGETARLIVEEMKRGGGLITLEDLKKYKAVFRIAHEFDYKNYHIIGMPMPSSGGLLVNQMMKMVEKRNLAKMGFHSVEAVQLMAEVERIAFADRGEYMGDIDFYSVPVKKLVSEQYLEERMKLFTPMTAGTSTAIGPGDTNIHESEETTHISIIDREGNAIAITTTLNDSYGSRTVVGKAGFLLNDEMDDFSIKPGVPNMYGAIGGEANSIQPGKRMLSSMSPTIVMKEGKPFLVLGTPGGTTIPTSVFQTLINILEFGLSTEDAVNKPKFHHQWLPDSLSLEKNFPAKTREALEKMGYRIKYRSAIGRTEVIKVLPNGKFEGVADNRGDDSAEGY